MNVPSSGRRPTRTIVVIAAALALVVTALASPLNPSNAGAVRVANPGPLNLTLDGGTISIKDTEFDLTPNPFPECSDFLDNDDDGNVDWPADPGCSGPNDNAEAVSGNQPKQEISITGTIDEDGNAFVPAAGVSFPPVYLGGTPAGTVTVRILPTADGTGNLDPLTGIATVNVSVRIKLEGGSGLTALGDNCFIGSVGAPLALQMTTETTSPPAPNAPITGTRYDAETGTATLVNNSFSVAGASGCGLGGLGNGLINDELGLPSAAGNNTAVLEGRITPAIERGVNAVVTGGPFRSDTIEEISFDGSGSNAVDGPIASYEWDFGDGNTASGPSTTHTYAEAGFYTASLTVTDQVGDAHTREIAIRAGTAGVPPTAVIDIAQPEPDEEDPETLEELLTSERPFRVDFRADGSSGFDGPITYFWDFGDGNTSTEKRPVHVYAVDGPAGNFDATLTVTDQDGLTATTSVPVTILNDAPVALFTQDPVGGGINPIEVNFDASDSFDPDGEFLDYDWDFGDGNTASGPVVSHTYTTDGDFTITLTVTDSDGATDQATAQFSVSTVNLPPVADAGPDQTGRRSLQTVNLDGTGSFDPTAEIASYQWTQVSGVPVTINNPSSPTPSFQIPPKPDFVYPHDLVFQLVVTDTFGLVSDPDTVSIDVIATTPSIGSPSQSPTGNRVHRQDLLWSAPITNPDGYPVSWEWEMTRDAGAYLPPAGTSSAGTAGTFGPLNHPTPKMTLAAQNKSTGGIFSSANGPQVRARITAQLPGGPVTTGWANYTGNIGVSAPGSTPVVNTGPYQTVTPGASVTLSGTPFPGSGGGSLSYEWSQTGGTPVILLTSAQSTTFTAPTTVGELSFELVMTQGSTESLRSPVKVNVVPEPPTADAGANQSGFVVGDTVTLDATGSTGNAQSLTYAWTQTSGPSVTLSGANSATPTFTAPGGPSTLTFQVTVGATNTPLTTTDTVTVSVNNSPPVANAGPDQITTENNVVNLDGTGSSDPDGQSLAYSWTQIGGPPVTLAGANTATPSYTPGPGVRVFQLTVNDGQGGTATDTVQVTTLAAPNVSFTATPTSSLPPLELDVDASATFSVNGLITAYDWDFGNGQTATGVTASATYPDPGTYTVTLTVTDQAGAQATATDTVQVFNLPTAAFTATPTSGDVPLEVEVDASASDSIDGEIVSWEWDFGNGDTASGETASTTYVDDNTLYTITLTVTDSNGGVAVATQDISVGNLFPDAVLEVTPTTGLNPLQVVADGSDSSDPDGSIVDYTFSVSGETDGGDPVDLGPVSGAEAEAAFELLEPGSYTVTLVVTDDGGLTDTATEEVTVGENQAPVAAFTADPTSGLNPLVVNVDASASTDDGEIVEYVWFFDNGDIGGGVTASTTYTDPGTYEITLIVADDKGLVDTESITIEVGENQSPTAVIAATPLSGLDPLDVDVDASDSFDDGEIVSYEWDFGNGDTATGVTASTTYTDPGTYEIDLTVTDDKGLIGTATATIEVGENQAPVAAFSADPTTGLNPLVVDVDASASSDDGSIVSYEWDFGDGNTATGVTAQNTYADPGTYEITLTVTDDKGLTGTATETVEVGENQAPVASFTAIPNFGDIPLDVDVDASASTDDGEIVSYEWDFGNGDTATGVTASTTYVAAGTYEITLTVTDDKGLTDSTSTTVTANVPLAQRDALSLRITGAFDYEYEGPTDTAEFRITRDLFGPVRVRGTETFDSPVAGTASFRATLDRFLIFNAFTGSVRVTDTVLGGARNADVLLGGLAQPSATSVRGGATGFTQPFFQGQYNVQFTIDDRAN